MNWVTGIRNGTLYTISKRPIDPRWSQRDLQKMLAWCATAQHFGFDDTRALQTAEALVMKSIYHGIVWPESRLTEDMRLLEAKCLAGTTSDQVT